MRSICVLPGYEFCDGIKWYIDLMHYEGESLVVFALIRLRKTLVSVLNKKMIYRFGWCLGVTVYMETSRYVVHQTIFLRRCRERNTADFRHLCNTNAKEKHISDTKFIHPDNIHIYYTYTYPQKKRENIKIPFS